MSRFNFRLQKVLDLREQSARIAAAQLAVAQIRADDARDARDALAVIRQAGGAQMGAAHNTLVTAGQIQNSSYLMERLDQRIDLAGDTANAAMGSLELARTELMRAHQAQRALDRLRDRRLSDWQHSNLQSDRAQMDALALSQFTRRNPHTTDES